MRKLILLFGAGIFIFLLFFTFTRSIDIEMNESSVDLGERGDFYLEKGKNLVFFDREPFYVSDLVLLNPEIEVVAYQEDNKSVGYVNVFGGVGRDFIISHGEYEIIASDEINLVLP